MTAGTGDVMTAGSTMAGRLVISPWISLESLDRGEAVIFHSVTAARLRVSRAVYDFLRRFQDPATVEGALGREPVAGIWKQVEVLLEKGFLVDADARTEATLCLGQRRRTVVSESLFNCPRGGPDTAADVAVIGVPYDAGDCDQPGVQRAPREIRRQSWAFAYELDFTTGLPRGWFDVEGGHRILEGVTFCDWGDVFIQHGEPREDLLGRIDSIVDDMAAEGSLPIVLGGERDVSLPAVSALARRRELAVLRLDGGGSFDSGLRELDGVSRLARLGCRGYTSSSPPEGVDRVSVDRYRREGLAAVLGALPDDLPVYVSLNVNVLDPAFAPGTSHPVPGGFSFDEVKQVLRTLGRRRELAGLDLVGVHPRRDVGSITSLSACHLLLATLSGISFDMRP